VAQLAFVSPNSLGRPRMMRVEERDFLRKSHTKTPLVAGVASTKLTQVRKLVRLGCVGAEHLFVKVE